MNFKTEDFPTPVSPTRRIVYGAFALFFNALMAPCLRDSMSLRDTVRDHNVQMSWNLLDHRSLVTTLVIQGIAALSSRIIF